ncbi:ketopantoate reductase family protein [Nocardia altamirensis]|uniref:ketopantoate reductase family protein n=1 Tax=Nocardia altamirensis TaxID=472158 RepID=UPI00083FDE76|nr:2-dehydropantoate 2-reductase [Nocardia altamirensis]
MDVKRFIVYGAGAVGGSLGAFLHRAGHEVVLIARGPHLDAIRDRGLRVVTGAGAAMETIPAVSGPDQLVGAAGDVVLLAVKSMNTEAALRDLTVAVDRATPIVCLQNGVANEPAALRMFSNVYGVCVMFPTTHLEPGVVEARAWPVPAILDIGRYPAGVDDTAEAVAAAFRSAGCHAEPRADIMRWKYHKLLMNLGNAVDALVRPTDDVTEILDRARIEGMKVLTAAGISFVTAVEDGARRGDVLRVGVRRSVSSSWQSLARGTGSIETDYLNGEIVLLGRRHGVPTPVNERIQHFAEVVAREGRPPGSVPLSELVAALG